MNRERLKIRGNGMSERIMMYKEFEMYCPHCDDIMEVGQIEVSVCIMNTDVGRPTGECVFTHECESCGGKVKVTPHLDIDVEAVEASA